MKAEDVEKIIPEGINDLCYYRGPNGKEVPVFPYIIAVTGHRCGFAPASSSNPRGFDEDAIKNAFKRQLKGIAKKWRKTSKGTAPIILLTGMADGADQIAAEAALEIDPQLNVKVVAVLPMERNLFRLTVNNEIRFNDLMGRAHYTFVLPPDCSDVELRGVDVPETEERLQRQNDQLASFLAQNSHVLFAFWDGIDDKDPKGTAKVVHLKLRGTEEFENRSDFLTYPSVGPVVQLLTPRDDEANRTATAANKLEFNEIPVFFWTRKNLRRMDESDPESKNKPTFPERSIMTKDRRLKKLAAKMGAIENALEKMGRLNADAVKYHTELEHGFKQAENCLWEEKANPERNLDAGSRVLLDHYLIADQLAGLFQERSQKLGRCCSKDSKKDKVNGYPYWVAALCFFGGILGLAREFYQNKWWQTESMVLERLTLICYFITAFIILVIYLWASVNKFLHRHFRSRAVAEALRVQIFWRIAGMNDCISRYYRSHQIDDSEWLRATVNGLVAFLPPPEPSGFKNKISERLTFVREVWIKGQLNFFENRIAERRKNYALEFWERPWFTVPLFILVVFGPLHSKFLSWIYDYFNQNSLCLLGFALYGVIVVSGASFFVYQAIKKQLLCHKQEADRYERMILPYDYAVLSTEKTPLVDEDSIEHWRQIFRQLGAEAITENADWLLTVGERELLLPR